MKKLNKYEFSGGVGDSTYDWNKLLDGSIYSLDKGEEGDTKADYTCETSTFTTLARSAAKKRGKTLKTEKTETGVVIQAVEASKDQIKAWADADAKKKAEKEAKKKADAEQAEVEGEGEGEEDEETGEDEE